MNNTINLDIVKLAEELENDIEENCWTKNLGVTKKRLVGLYNRQSQKWREIIKEYKEAGEMDENNPLDKLVVSVAKMFLVIEDWVQFGMGAAMNTGLYVADIRYRLNRVEKMIESGEL